jgi:hypothetical protein
VIVCYEPSTETEIFVKDKLEEERFKNENVVSSFLQSMNQDLRRWFRILKTRGGIGGYNPECRNNESNWQSNIFEKRCEVRNHLKKLMLKVSDRMIVKATILNIRFSELNENVEQIQQNSDLEVIGNTFPSEKNIVLSLDGLYSKDVKIAVENLCLLKLENNEDWRGTRNVSKQIILVELLLSDCKIVAECSLSWDAISTHSRDLPLLFNLDLFRYRAPMPKKPDWDGVLIVINSIKLDQKITPTSSPIDTSSHVPNTCEIAQLFQ